MKKKIAIIFALILMFSQMPLVVMAEENVNTQEVILEQTIKTVSADSVIDVLSKDGRFKVLLKALQSTGLLKALEGNGTITIFAPTDEAFSKLPKESLDNILKEQNKKELINILSYHITMGEITTQNASELNGKDINMLNGEEAKITVKDGIIYINNIKAEEGISTKNGIIHAIDTVMTP